MQLQVDIGFDQLVQLVKRLPATQWTKLKAEVDFIIDKDNEIIPIEVKISAEPKIERSLRLFIEMYKPKRAFLVSYKGEKKTMTANEASGSKGISKLWVTISGDRSRLYKLLFGFDKGQAQ